MRAFLQETSGRDPRVVVTSTESSGFDLDTANLKLSVRGQGIPAAVRQDFKREASTDCTLERSFAVKGVQFISPSDRDDLFRGRNGWAKFHVRYGKEASLVTLSRVGLDPDKNFAIIYVTSGIERMAASGYLYVLQKVSGKWIKKAEISVWNT